MTRSHISAAGLALAVVLLVAVSPAFAESKIAVPAAPPGSQYLGCKKERITGTRIPQKVCRYESQIKEERDDARRYLRDSYRINSRGASRAGGPSK